MTTAPLAELADPTLLKTDGLINGECKGASRVEVLDPSNDNKLADVANLGATEAISAASAAWPAWRNKDRQGAHPAKVV